MLEGHLIPDHVHVLLSMPPNISVAQVVGFIKDKSTIQITQIFSGHKKELTGQHFLVRRIICPLLAKMSRPFATTSRYKKQKNSGSISSICLDSCHHQVSHTDLSV